MALLLWTLWVVGFKEFELNHGSILGDHGAMGSTLETQAKSKQTLRESIANAEALAGRLRILLWWRVSTWTSKVLSIMYFGLI